MYYVIKRQIDKLPSTFIGFQVPKYIASKSNENVIFLFSRDGKVIRKWVKLKDIILLTEDEAFYTETMKKFRKIEKEQQAIVDEAHAQLERSMSDFAETMNTEINDFEEIRNSSDVPCILKDL